jgi:hypothetical protein
LLAITVAIGALLFAPVARSGTSTPRAYAHQLTIATWHSEYEFQALDAIVTPESHWNPCASYPGRHDCSYSGSNSCGIPQANPCPPEWRGRLGTTWRAQVRWLISYVQRRYGSPSRALLFRRAHGWY